MYLNKEIAVYGVKQTIKQQFLLTFKQGEAAEYEQKSKKDYPGLRRKEKCADGHRAKNQKHETDILGFFVYVEASFLSVIVVVHISHPI